MYNTHSNVYNSGSQPFLVCGTPNMRKNLAAHLYLKNFDKDLGKDNLFYKLQQNIPFPPKRVVKVMSKKWMHT